jgi:4-amino-4-deoxychorismate lyase
LGAGSARVQTWVDGEPTNSLPLPDRALAFGDGVFETLLLVGGRALLPAFHRQRLAQGLSALQFPELPDALDRTLALVADTAPAGPAALRLTVSRGGGPRGYAPPAVTRPRLIAQLSPLEPSLLDWQAPAQLGRSGITWPLQPLLAGIKHLNRLEQVLAAAEYQRQGLDEAVMLDSRGRVVSVVAGNLFALREDRLCTPALEDCGIRGTRRRAVIERWAPALDLAVTESDLGWDDLLASDEVFYCNALVGLRAVGAIGERRWHDFPVTRSLHQQYRQALAGGGRV